MPWSLLLNPTVLLSLALAGASGWAWIQGKRLDSAQTALEAVRGEYATFKAGVAEQGRIAQEKALQQAKLDRKRKEKADEAHQSVVAGLNATLERVRDERDRARGDLLPAPSPTAKRPHVSCFQRSDFEREISAFVAGAGEIIEGCDRLRVDLDAARSWAKQQMPLP